MSLGSPTLNVVELFCGTSGLGLGAELAGFELALAADKDDVLTSTHERNFPRCSLQLGDLRGASARVLLQPINERHERITGVIGGPPCQGFSHMGRRSENDPRNDLVVEFFRLVAEINPKFFLMENVPGMLQNGYRGILDAAIQHVTPRYEILGPVILDAADFGTPTRRKRAVILGFNPLEMASISLADIMAAKSPSVTVGEAIEDLPGPTFLFPDPSGEHWAKYPDRNEISDYALSARKMPPAGLGSETARNAVLALMVSGMKPTAHTFEVERRFSKVMPGQVDRISRAPRLQLDGLCSTLRAGTGSDRGSYQAVRPIHPNEARVITVREAARLQGFPDWFVFHPAIWHSFRMIGNSVSPPFAKALLKLIASKLVA